MSNWSEEATRRSRDRQAARQSNEQKSLQDRNTLNNKGRALWGTLKASLGRKCTEFNGEPGNTGALSMVGNVDELTVSCTGRREMIKGTFGNDEVCFSGKNGVQYEKRTFIRLTLDGLDVWLAADFGLPVDLEELTSEIVETLLAASGR